MKKILSLLVILAMVFITAVPVSAQTRRTANQPKKRVNVSPGAVTAMGRMTKSLSDARKAEAKKEGTVKTTTSTRSTRSTYSDWGR
ncbi:MAG: hypothetical protein WCV56_06630 [Candidatus Omnitrophota bacterium]